LLKSVANSHTPFPLIILTKAVPVPVGSVPVD
jgi:hypothetical protein